MTSVAATRADVPGLLRRTRQAEDGVAWVRAAIVVFNVTVYWWLMDPAGTRPQLALAISLVAPLYSGFILLAKPQRGASILGTAAWTTAADAGLIVTWLFATGGAASPFAPLWAVSLAAIAFRFGPRTTVLATALYIFLDMVVVVWGPQALSILPVEALVRSAYIGFAGAVLVLMSSFSVHVVQREESLAATTVELESSQQRLLAVTDNAPSTIMLTDCHGIIEYINRPAPGFGKEDAIGRSLVEFLPPDQVPVLLDAQRQVLADGEMRTYEIEQDVGDGERRTWHTRMGAIRGDGGRVTGLVLVSLDVTEQRREQQEAAKARQLEEEAEFRTQFINAAAHELNTPMTPIRLQLSVLERRLEGATTPEVQRSLDVLERNIERLAMLSGDLLEATRIQAQRVRLEMRRLDAAHVVHEAIESFDETAIQRGITLKHMVRGPAILHADPLRLSQIIFNLMSNALKFTPDGSTVIVQAGVDEGGFRVDVKDEGPGLTAAQIDCLFKPFSQVHPSPRPEEPGTGLGLYICQGLAMAHGGFLEAQSAGPGNGSTFRLWLPIEHTPGGGAPAAP